MARYTDTKEFSFGSLVESRTLIVNGSVTISAFDGDGWTESDTLTTGTVEIFTRNTRLRFAPANGASYWIDEQGGY